MFIIVVYVSVFAYRVVSSEFQMVHSTHEPHLTLARLSQFRLEDSLFSIHN